MFLGNLPFTPEVFAQYIDYAVIGIMVFCALVGFIRGTYKSIYYLIATLLIFIGGFLIMSTVSEMLMNIDLSSANITYNLGGTAYTVTTMKEAVYNMVQTQIFNGADISDSVTMTVVLGITQMLVKVVYTIILIVVAFTLFKLIADIIWLFIRPSKTKKIKVKQKDKNGKEKIKVKEEKKTKSFLSRLLGAGIGAAKGLLYTLLIFFLVAGIVSIVESVEVLQSSNTSETYNVVIVEDTLTLVSYSEVSENKNGIASILDEYQEYFDLALSYRDTIPGKVFGSIKIGEAKLDEYVFDAIISANGKDENITYNIKLRKELKDVIEALSKCPELLEGNFSLETLSKMDKAQLKETVDILTNLEIVKVVMPVALEVVILSDLVTNNLPEDLKEVIKGLDINQIRQLDYASDFKDLGYMFVDITSILEFDEDGKMNLDFISLPKDVVSGIFEKLGGLNIVDFVAPIAVSYVLNLSTVKDKFAEFNIDIDSLGLDDIKDWGSEIGQIGKIYGAFCDLGLTTEDIKNMDLSKVEIEKVDSLTEAIFDSLVISKAVPVVVDYALTMLPDEYKGIITLPENTNWEAELTPLLKATVTLLSSGILDNSDPNQTIVDKLKALPDENIEKLSEYLSRSNIITGSLNGLIDQLLGGEGKESLLGDITLKGLDSSSDWTKQEIGGLFKSIKVILNSGLLDEGDDYLAKVKAISNDTIDSLSLNLSSSKFFRRNFSSIIDYLMNSLNKDGDKLELVGLSENEWTNDELSNILYTFREIASSGIISNGSNATEGIKMLSDEVIDNLGTYISSSKFFTTNLTPLMDFLLSGVDMGDIKIVGFSNSEDWTKLEIVSLLKSARLIVNYQSDLTQIVNLSEDDLDILMNSKLINSVLVDFIKEYSKEGKPLEIVKGIDLLNDAEWNDQYLEEIGFSYASGVLDITSPSDFDVDKYYIYVKNALGEYEKVGSTDGLNFDLNTILSPSEKRSLRGKANIYTLPNKEDILVKAVKFGEIRNMFLAVQTIVGDVSGGIDGNKILSNLTSITESGIEQVLKSKVVCETIITQIENYASGDTAFISIPEGDLTKLNADGTKDRTAWLEGEGTHGELYKALKAITVVFNGIDLSGEFTFTTDLITGISDSDIDTIVESAIINETLIYQLEKFASEEHSVIYLPNELLVSTNKIDREKWNDNKETYNILCALKTVFSGASIDTSNLKLKPIIDGKDEILKSLVLIETVKRNIINVEGIDVPMNESLSLDSLDGWKNTYNENGVVTSYGEVNAILNAVSLILDLTDDTTISNINADNIKIGNIITKSDEVLKSLIISETVRCKLMSVNGIDIPTGEGLSTTDLTGWKNTYDSDGNVLSRGEISNMLKAINCVLNFDDNTDISTINADSIKLGGIITNKDTVLKSLVISETVRVKVTSIDSIDIPENEGLSKTTLDGWRNTYNSNGEVVSEGEISRLLTAVNQVLNFDDTTSLESINADTIKIGNIITKSDEILKSLVISETVRCKLMSVNGIDIPTGEGLSTTDLTGWKNTYDSDGNVLSRGEISNMLKAINCVLNFDDNTDISTINADSIKLGGIITNKDTVLKSLVISETVRTKVSSITSINIPSNEGLATDGLDGWKNTYDADGNLVSEGEISRLLTAVNQVLNFDDTTSLESINADTIKIGNIITKSDEILKSLVISETVRCKLMTISGINIPTGEGLSTTDLTGWKNIYNSDGTIETKGEISNLLTAINQVLNFDDNTDISTINADSIKLGGIITNRNTVLKSLVISETVRTKLTSISSINIPINEGLSTTSLTGWKNTYKANGDLETEGEISKLLSSINAILNFDDSTSLESINADTIKIQNVILQSDEVLKSKVISETIRVKLSSIGGISIPNGEGLSSIDLAGWKNEYNSDGNVLSRGEISSLLNAINIVIGVDDSTTLTSFNMNGISLKNIIDNSDNLLKSLVISETIRTKICGNSVVTIPNSPTLSTTSLSGWKNVYNEDGYAIQKGELSYLLSSLAVIINPSDSTGLDGFSMDINLGTIIGQRDTLLRSEVISATVKKQIIDMSEKAGAVVTLPQFYNDSSSANYINWTNTYVDTFNTTTHKVETTVTSRGEIDALLAGIGSLLGDTNTTLDGISSFNFSAIFESSSQATIIRSKVISETIITKLEAMSSTLKVPTGKGFDNQADRTNWWNEETGELKYFLTGVSSLLSNDQKENLSSISLGVDNVYASLTDNVSRTKLLQSYVISETLTVNFAGLSILTIPTVENCGVDLNLTSSHDTWYVINNDRTIEYNELWNLIESIKILLGGSFDSSVSFTIDKLLANPEFVPTLDANKNNTNDTLTIFLRSKMMEQVFIGLVKNIVVEGAMKDYLVTPLGGYNWYYKQYEDSLVLGKEYDLETILESIYMMTSAGLGYDMNFNLASLDIDKVSDAYVLSRTFRGSIAKTFNGLLETPYNTAYLGSVYLGSPIAPWSTVMFVQSEFDSPKTRLEAQTLLASKLTTIKTNIQSVSA